MFEIINQSWSRYINPTKRRYHTNLPCSAQRQQNFFILFFYFYFYFLFFFIFFILFLGREENVRLLLNAGADISIRPVNKESCLFRACTLGKTQIARMLIEKNPSELFYEGNNCNVLIASSINSNIETAEMLVFEMGVNINLAHSETGLFFFIFIFFIFLFFIFCFFCFFIFYFLFFLFFIFYFFIFIFFIGNSCLHNSVSSGKFEFVEWCIKMGANINLRNKLDNTPLSFAKNQQIINLLKSKGAVI